MIATNKNALFFRTLIGVKVIKTNPPEFIYLLAINKFGRILFYNKKRMIIG